MTGFVPKHLYKGCHHLVSPATRDTFIGRSSENTITIGSDYDGSGTGNLNLSGQVYCESSSFPVLGFQRNTSLTGGNFSSIAGIASAMGLYTNTSGNMTDGFGGGIVFYATDSGINPGTNALGRLYFRRDGADNEGALQIWGGTSAGEPLLTARASGNLGIFDITSPSERLHIKGNIFLNDDNNKIIFGAGKNASIFYDGTDLNINTKDVGSGTLKINGVSAWSGTFTNGDGDTVTVTDGIITNVV